MLQNGAVLPADVLIFDLEDSVAPAEKDAARELVASALRSIDYGRRGLAVRINDLEKLYVKKDLEAVVTAGARSVMVPKVNGARTLHHVAVMLDLIEEECGIEKGRTKVIALIETALGIEKAFEAAMSTPRVEALALRRRRSVCRSRLSAYEGGNGDFLQPFQTSSRCEGSGGRCRRYSLLRMRVMRKAVMTIRSMHVTLDSTENSRSRPTICARFTELSPDRRGGCLRFRSR